MQFSIRSVMEWSPVQFILAFVLLHTLTWSTMILYQKFCMDISVLGYFRTMLSGHSPMCNVLLSIGYHGTNEMYHLLSSVVMSTIFLKLTQRVLKKKE